MKIISGNATVICENKNSIHNYFAWPSVTRLPDGRLAMVASGFRLSHICPFGKGVICYSHDEGATWTAPAVILDTPLDDRDCGICTFGAQGVIVTSFNNSIAFQKKYALRDSPQSSGYIDAYLEKISNLDCEERFLGSTFIVSQDGGNTFGDVYRVPVSSPHGPCVLPDGTLLYVGRFFDVRADGENVLGSYRIFPDGHSEKLGEIANVPGGLQSWEPHAIVLNSGTVLVHIRVQNKDHFTVYQCESSDGGKTFTEPYPVLADKGGAPAHLLRHSSGMLLSVYGYREVPYGIRVMFSRDEGKTWNTDAVLWENRVSADLGYPCSVELRDGHILTVFYGHTAPHTPAVILQKIWRFEE